MSVAVVVWYPRDRRMKHNTSWRSSREHKKAAKIGVTSFDRKRKPSLFAELTLAASTCEESRLITATGSLRPYQDRAHSKAENKNAKS